MLMISDINNFIKYHVAWHQVPCKEHGVRGASVPWTVLLLSNGHVAASASSVVVVIVIVGRRSRIELVHKWREEEKVVVRRSYYNTYENGGKKVLYDVVCSLAPTRLQSKPYVQTGCVENKNVTSGCRNVRTLAPVVGAKYRKLQAKGSMQGARRSQPGLARMKMKGGWWMDAWSMDGRRKMKAR